MNKLKATLLALALLTGMTASPEFAAYQNSTKICAESEDSSSVFEYVQDEYTLIYSTNGNEATICSCTCKDKNLPIYMRDYISKLEIPEKIDGYTVTEIGDDALEGIMYKELSLPETIRKLGNNSLGSNSYSELDTFTFPRDTEEIGDNVFSGLYASKIVIPAKVSSISKYAFTNNYNFEVEPENKYFHIYQNALMSSDNKNLIKYCGNKETFSYYVPDGTVEIYPHAFEYANISSIRIPDSVETIGSSAFSSCRVTNITLPNKLTRIEDYTFAYTLLTQISLPESVEYIGRNAFTCSDLENITIPKNIKKIEDFSFSRCDCLEEISLPEGLESIGRAAFSECRMLRTVSLPDTLKTIGDEAFSESGLTGTVSIPAGLTTLPQSAFMYTNISGYEIPEENKYYSSENNILFDKEKKTVIHCPSQNSIKSCVLPETVTSIENGAFYKCENIIRITIPDEVETIGSYTFYENTSLESIKFPAELKTIEEAAFAACTRLHDIKLPSKLEEIQRRAFEETAIETINIPESVTSLSNYAFEFCSGLKTIRISPYLHNFDIVIDADIEFYEDDSVSIKDGVVYSKDMTVLINYPAFNKNENNEFTVPDCVTQIADNAFKGSSLRKITLSKNISSIGDYAFANCTKLEETDYNGCTPKLGKGIFAGCRMLYRIDLPENITVIPENTFVECTGIYSARIPDGTKTLESGSMPCILSQVYIPSSVTKISEDAFATDHLSVISGESGSYAEKFASENNIKFVSDSKETDGDVNGDGKINIIDLIKLKSYFISESKDSTIKSDINGDGKTSVIDLVKLINILHGINDNVGYKNIEVTREKLFCKANTNYYNEKSSEFITDEKELESTFANYFSTRSDITEYTEKYSGYLDDYVIYTNLYHQTLPNSVPVLDAQVYSIDDNQMTFKITDIPEREYSSNDTMDAYLFTVLMPRSIYNGQKVNYVYDQQVVFADKPVIYLYPEEETTINVKVELDDRSEFSCTYPEYPKETGWTVTAEPDSTLYYENNSYPYLFWEAATTREWDMSEGFVVRGEDTKEFFREKLSFLGLEPLEYTEFISFWAPKMENNKYNLISFQTDDYEEMAKLIVTPEPESIQRVFMTYKPLDEWTEIPEQKLTPFRRSGYTLIEWGGSEVK